MTNGLSGGAQCLENLPVSTALISESQDGDSPNAITANDVVELVTLKKDMK